LPAETVKRLGPAVYLAGTDNPSTIMDKLNDIEGRLTRIEALLSREDEAT
jgi:hypothetical protein